MEHGMISDTIYKSMIYSHSLYFYLALNRQQSTTQKTQPTKTTRPKPQQRKAQKYEHMNQCHPLVMGNESFSHDEIVR